MVRDGGTSEVETVLKLLLRGGRLVEEQTFDAIKSLYANVQDTVDPGELKVLHKVDPFRSSWPVFLDRTMSETENETRQPCSPRPQMSPVPLFHLLHRCPHQWILEVDPKQDRTCNKQP